MITRTKFLFALMGATIFVAVPMLSAHAQTSAMKQPVQGLVDMQDIGFYRDGTPASFTLANVNKYPGQFGGVVLNVTWAQLQPAAPPSVSSAPVPLRTLYIDTALAKVAYYNKHNAKPLGVKLRVWGGFSAPQWAKNLGGGAVTISKVVHGSPESLGRYWTESYRQAWRNLQSALARKYDGNPLIREVAVTSCAWATDEPFVQWIGPSEMENFTSLQQAGYSAAQETKCLSGAIADYAPWKTTYLDFPFNPLQMYLTTYVNHCQHKPYGKLWFCNLEDPTKAVMLQCAHSGRCILSNQALYKEGPTPVFPYNFIDDLYAKDPAVKVDFQTASPNYVSGPVEFCEAIKAAKTFHASSVELWPGAGKNPGFTALTPAQVIALANTMDGTGVCDAGE